MFSRHALIQCSHQLLFDYPSCWQAPVPAFRRLGDGVTGRWGDGVTGGWGDGEMGGWGDWGRDYSNQLSGTLIILPKLPKIWLYVL
ncbi:MAG: hypothetical protein F6K58_28210 [Symploca sp. SIO2E9]|nr:hypothetical protein [Symploca sp. SIO2E9]